MSKYLALGLFFCMLLSSRAHNPNNTALSLIQEKGLWSLHLLISQQGAHEALQHHYKKVDLHLLSKADYQKKYMQYVRDKLIIWVDTQRIQLGSGGIKLGKHQTEIRWLLPTFPLAYETLKMEVNVFCENPSQHTMVRITDGNKRFRKLLHKKNGFQLSCQTIEGAFVAIEKKQEGNWGYYVFIVATLSIIFLGVSRSKLLKKRSIPLF